MTISLTMQRRTATAVAAVKMIRFPLRRPDDDATLLRRAFGGDSAARRRLAERLGPFIKARVLRATRGEAIGGLEVCDLVHEVWGRLFADDARLLRDWDPERASLPGYVNLLTGQIVSKTRRAQFAQRRHPEGGSGPLDEAAAVADAAPAPDEHAAERARLRALWTHLEDTLPPIGRVVLHMLYADHRAPADIARALGVSDSAVYGWRHKIKRAAVAFEEGTDLD